jgi:hypothetical protein
MKKISLKQWTNALRSGRYDQTQETLYDIEDQAFCCLGVGCDVAGMVYDYTPEFYDKLLVDPFAIDSRWYFMFTDQRHLQVGFTETYEALEAFLTRDAMETLKRRLGTNDPAALLAGWNDGGVSFEEIADIIDGIITQHDD